MRSQFDPRWRTQKLRRRRFYAKYMLWLERAGYAVVALVLAAFILAFNAKVDDLITADKVPITPAAVVVSTSRPALVVKALVSDWEEVTQGQAILEIVEGETNVQKHEAWRLSQALSANGQLDAQVRASLSRISLPNTRVLRSPSNGVFHLDVAQIGKRVEPDSKLAEIFDFNDLRLKASLAGNTVGLAQVGQTCRITAIVVESPTGVLFRGESPQGAVISGSLLGEDVKSLVATELKGYAVKLRDDVPLELGEVSEVHIDAQVERSFEPNLTTATLLEPESTTSLSGTVISGSPSASVQIADLPPAISEKLRSAVTQRIQSKPVVGLDGKTVLLHNPRDIHTVVRFKSNTLAKEGALLLPASQLSRSFEAELKVNDPPAYLRQAVKNALKAGKTVTAKVEVKTSTRPIALILLKKS